MHCFDGWKLEAAALTALGIADRPLNAITWLRDNVSSTSWFDDKADFKEVKGLAAPSNNFKLLSITFKHHPKHLPFAPLVAQLERIAATIETPTHRLLFRHQGIHIDNAQAFVALFQNDDYSLKNASLAVNKYFQQVKSHIQDKFLEETDFGRIPYNSVKRIPVYDLPQFKDIPIEEKEEFLQRVQNDNGGTHTGVEEIEELINQLSRVSSSEVVKVFSISRRTLSRWDKAKFCKTYGMPWKPGVKVGGNLILYDMYANREVIKVAWDKETDSKRRQQIAYELKKAQSADCNWDESILDDLAAKEERGEFAYETAKDW